MKSMNRSMIIASLVAMVSLPAFAAQGGGNNNQNNSDIINNTYNNTTHNGGQGGQGGHGVGVGIGIGQGGKGGSAWQQQQQQQQANIGNGLGNFSPVANAKGGEANAHAGAISGSSSKSDSKSSSNSGSFSGSNSGGNKMSINQNFEAQDSLHYSGEYTVKNTPGIAIGSLYPSANCHGASNAGGSGPGFSIAFGTSWKDDDCGIRETARAFHGMGMTKDAIAVLCSSTYAAKAPACQAPAKKAEAVATPVASGTSISEPAAAQQQAQAPSRNTDASATRYVSNGVVWTRPDVYSAWTPQQ